MFTRPETKPLKTAVSVLVLKHFSVSVNRYRCNVFSINDREQCLKEADKVTAKSTLFHQMVALAL